MSLLPVGISGEEAGYQIERSLRFNSADSAYLNRTPASDTSSNKKGTFSGWVKVSANSGTNGGTFLGATDGYHYGQFFNQTFYFGNDTSSINTAAVFRDFSAWYHVLFVFDTTLATANDRMQIWVNGVRQVVGSFNTQPSLNSSFVFLNTAQAYNIGRRPSGNYFNGYLTEINFIDGSALDPTSFGEFNTDTGVWQPKAYTGSYGTNGFYLNFSDNSGVTSTTLGADSSGNGNNWTPNNFSVTAGAGNDSLVDTPTPYGTDTGLGGEVRGNYATLNTLDKGANISVTNGNLTATVTSTGGIVLSTFGVSSGKWYWEMERNGGTDCVIGIARASASKTAYLGSDANGWGYIGGSGNKVNNASSIAYGTAYASGVIVGVALDMDAGTVTFYRNGTSQGTAYSGLTGTIFPAFGTGNNTDSVFANFGQRPFAYTAPSGFKALCTQNLPEPTIVDGGEYFNTVLYTGTGASGNSQIVGFQPDFTWIKKRSGADNNTLINILSGADKWLISNLTDSEYSGSGFTFDANGFTPWSISGSTNASGETFVAWNWKANGAGVTNTAGTITSTVSANTDAGFSIVTYTGTGANATVGHGLGVAPSMVIVKNRAINSDWLVQSSSLTSYAFALVLSGTNAQTSAANWWNNTAPTSTTFSIGDGSAAVSGNGNSHVAYCFAPISGYSAAFSYTGNGSSDGPFVFLNFRPRFILTKRSDSADDWNIIDTTRITYNEADAVLFANLSNAEYTTSDRSRDILSNGFKVRDTNAEVNASGGTYIGMAFAENPFKYSLAR